MLYKVPKVAEINEKSAQFRFGITVSKKVGNAVKRNRVKRIIRVLIRDICVKRKYNNLIINVIARKFIVGKSFNSIRSDFIFCLNKVTRS